MLRLVGSKEEKAEQQELRRAYIDSFKKNLRSQLNNIDVQEADGSITNLGEKYGQKYNHRFNYHLLNFNWLLLLQPS